MTAAVTFSDPLVVAADRFAAQAHAGMVRKGDGKPFISHPRRVAALVAERGYPAETVAAALLHDVVEDTDHTLDDIQERFGARVTELVGYLTEDKALPYDERKAAHRQDIIDGGVQAQAIFAGDVYANLTDLLDAYREQGEQIARHFNAPLDTALERFAAEIAMLAGQDVRAPLLDELDATLAELRAARAGR